MPGSEFWVLYRDGVPAGYVQLQPKVAPAGTHGQIRYFGLTPAAIGHGLGGSLSEHGIAAGWTIPQRHDLPRVIRVGVRTCTLEGPAALPSCQARGLVIYRIDDTDDTVPAHPGARGPPPADRPATAEPGHHNGTPHYLPAGPQPSLGSAAQRLSSSAAPWHCRHDPPCSRPRPVARERRRPREEALRGRFEWAGVGDSGPTRRSASANRVAAASRSPSLLLNR